MSEDAAFEAEVEALQGVIDRLAGFDGDLHIEWLDGALTALAVGPWQPPVQSWLGPLLGEEFERAYADPADVATAERAVLARLARLRRELDPERLWADPDTLHLSPLLLDFSDMPDPSTLPHWPTDPDERAAAQASAMAIRQGAAMWAEGFLDGTQLFPDVWVPLDSAEARDQRDGLVGLIEALLMPTEAGAPAADGTAPEPSAPTAREQAIDNALFAAQDLRLFWLDHPPKQAPRRVEVQPGRNEACPCGSGKKFKKCHGAV
jgi:uncharacterized protein